MGRWNTRSERPDEESEWIGSAASEAPASVEQPALGAAPAKPMDRSLAGSIAWRALADWSSQIVTWAAFLIVARLLSPADFGIVSMAVILYAYLKNIGEFGIPATVINRRDLTEYQLAQLNTIAVLLGVVCFGLGCALAFPLAVFFKTPRLAPVVVLTSLALVALGVRAVPEGLLCKEMRFRWLSIASAGCDVLAAAATLILALRGFAYWALVLGNLASAVTLSALMVQARPQGFAMPRLSSIRGHLVFGGHLMISTLALSSYERLDNLTAGRRLGAAALGFYGMAWNLANVPIEKVTTLVTTVVPSYLAAERTEPAALRRYLRGLTEVMAVATFPTTVGLGLVARELVPFALGRKWIPAVPALEVLSAYAAFRSMVALLPKLLAAVDKARFVMWTQLAALVILPCAFFIGSHWGTVGIAWGWVAAYPLVALPLYWKVFRTVGMRFREYFRAVRPALDSTLVMTAAVIVLKQVLPPTEPVLLRLVVEVVTGAATYISTIALAHRERAAVFWNLAKLLGPGRR